jgi:hypothetical protein
MGRAALIAVALAAVAGGLAYSLAGHGSSSASAAVSRGAGRLLDSGSSRVTITFGADDTFSAEGVVDYRAQRGRIEYGDFETTIFERDSTYVRMRDFDVLGGKPWVRFDGGESDPFDPQERALRDPAKLLPFLRESSGDVRMVGRETVGGVETTHYEGTLALHKVVDTAPAGRRDELQRMLDLMNDLDQPTAIPYGLWVDSSGLARRLRYFEGVDRSSTVTIEFSDFGVPVALDLPSPDQVMSANEFMDLAMKQDGDGSDCGQNVTSRDEGEGVIVLCTARSVEAK